MQMDFTNLVNWENTGIHIICATEKKYVKFTPIYSYNILPVPLPVPSTWPQLS